MNLSWIRMLLYKVTQVVPFPGVLVVMRLAMRLSDFPRSRGRYYYFLHNRHRAIARAVKNTKLRHECSERSWKIKTTDIIHWNQYNLLIICRKCVRYITVVVCFRWSTHPAVVNAFYSSTKNQISKYTCPLVYLSLCLFSDSTFKRLMRHQNVTTGLIVYKLSNFWLQKAGILLYMCNLHFVSNWIIYV